MTMIKELYQDFKIEFLSINKTYRSIAIILTLMLLSFIAISIVFSWFGFFIISIVVYTILIYQIWFKRTAQEWSQLPEFKDYKIDSCFEGIEEVKKRISRKAFKKFYSKEHIDNIEEEQ